MASVAAIVVFTQLGPHSVQAVATSCPGGMVGTGSVADPCLVTNASQLAAIDENTASLALHYRLANDITLTGSWTPIAPYADPSSPPFTGSLDGAGNAIIGLQIVDPAAVVVGLFGFSSGATFEQLRLTSVDITAGAIVGGMVGLSDNTHLDRVFISGSIHAEGGVVGGLIGYNWGLGTTAGPSSIQRSTAESLVITTGATGDAAGGFVGQVLDSVVVSDSSVSGSISARNYVGGLGGAGGGGANMSITDSVSTATLTVAPGRTKRGLAVNSSGFGIATKSYFDSDAAGTTDAGVDGGVAKTASQLKQLATYSGWDIGAGWDPAAGVWGICQSPDIRTFPFLNWTLSSTPCTPAPPPSAPTVTTGAASSIFANGATLAATVNANNGTTSAIAIYTTASATNAAARIGISHATTPTSAEGTDNTSVQSAVTGLQPNTTYYYWISATNSEGTSVGSVQTFTTIDGPPPLFPCTSYQWPGGSGTTANPYLIDDYVDLYQATQCPTASFRQRANVSLAEIDEWIPIGDLSDPFTGTYDGGRYRITDITYNDDEGDDVGLFGVTNGATIRNINSLTGTVLGRTSVGGLVGRATNTSISKVHSAIAVTGDPSSPVSSGSAAAYYVGGLVGQMNGGSIGGSSSSGAVTATGDGASTGNVVGGLVGYGNNVSIADSWATGDVFGIMDTGGLIGLLLGASTLTRSNAIGDVGGTGTGTAGGLIGQVDGSPVITDVFATGGVTTTRLGIHTGGLIGYVRSGTITRGYSTGAVSSQAVPTLVGGFIGDANGSDPSFVASLWNIQTSGMSDGAGSGAVSGVTGKTTAQMQTLSTFSDGGWDISETCATTADTVWALCPTENGGYPLLPREPAPEPAPEPTPEPTPSRPSNSSAVQKPSVETPDSEASTRDPSASQPPAPIAPARRLLPGRTFAIMDGVPIRVSLASAMKKNWMKLVGPGFTTDFSGVFRPVSEIGNNAVQPVLLPGRTVRVGGSGALPGSVVGIYLFSDPTTLTQITADASGAFEGEFRLPAHTPKGNHVLQVAMNTGKVVNASVGVRVAKTAQWTTTTEVRLSRSDTGLSKHARARLLKFAMQLKKDHQVEITCVASVEKHAEIHQQQLAHLRSTRVCDFIAAQSIRHLESLKATVASNKRRQAGLVSVVGTSTIS